MRVFFTATTAAAAAVDVTIVVISVTCFVLSWLYAANIVKMLIVWFFFSLI